jgi:hypothetical protein
VESFWRVEIVFEDEGCQGTAQIASCRITSQKDVFRVDFIVFVNIFQDELIYS